MNRADRRAARRQRGSAPALDSFADEIAQQLVGCLYGDCRAPATRWYSRVDLGERRLALFPACDLHDEQAGARSCDDEGCLQPEGHTPLRSPAVVMDQVVAAVGHGFGVGTPLRHNWQHLDVLRPY